QQARSNRPNSLRQSRALRRVPLINAGDVMHRQIIDLKSLDPRTSHAAKIAATLTDKLRQLNGIALLAREEWHAACIFRDLHHAVHDRPSEGVGSYDLHRHDGDGVVMASMRADRILRRVESGGELLKRYNNAVFAMVGLVDEQGY